MGILDIASRAKAHTKSEIAKVRANSAKSAASDAQTAVMTLEKRVDKLALINLALWSLVSEKCGFSEDDLKERVAQIDAMDGQADGKLSTGTTPCPQCGRPIASRVATCQFCGAERPKLTAFDDVV